ncbi:type I secretion C-terminal target domain-containing protein, partial [Halomonas sp. Mc5H-6]|uniref:type I secretion C-terminal target domain-containing protein n=1 Tax=Halomonas sp. Mc5H-6 TaxID=2954500 RepID=UPI00209772E0
TVTAGDDAFVGGQATLTNSIAEVLNDSDSEFEELATAGETSVIIEDTTPPIADPVLTNAEVGDDNPIGRNDQVLFKSFTVGGGVDSVVGGGFEQTPAEFEENPSLGAVDTNDLESSLSFVLTSLPTFGTLYVDLDGSGTDQGYVEASEGAAFNTDATLYWSVSKDEVEELAPATISGGSVSDWQSGDVDIYAYNIYGVKDESLLSVDGRGYLGVKDNTGIQQQVPDQLGQRGDGSSEELIFDFKKPVGEANVKISNLIGSEGEVGSVTAYLNGVSVGEWTFSNKASDELNGKPVDLVLNNDSFTLEGVVFDQLRFTAEEYADGYSKPGDSSDYFIQSIDYKVLPESGFSYKVIDSAGNESEVVDVTIGQPDVSTQVPEGTVLPDDYVIGVAAHTSGNGGGNGNTGTYANNGRGGRLKADAMDGSGSTVGAPKDSDGYYGVDHSSNGNNDNPNMIDGHEALLMKVAQPLTSMTFAIKGELDGATYSLFDGEGNRISEPSELSSANGRIEISSNTPFSYIAFDGSSSGDSEFSVKPIGYISQSGNQFIQGTDGTDTLNGQSGDDILVGGEGNDILYGGAGADTFAWSFGDEGEELQPAIDRVKDFTEGKFGTDDNADKLDLSDLLQGEDSGNINGYIFAEEDGDNVVLSISTEGNLNGSTSAADQKITLEGKSFSDFGVNSGASEDLIAKMIEDGQLKIDQ